ncbi:FAD-binding oxidoreductase [Angustibacter aerolatus]
MTEPVASPVTAVTAVSAVPSVPTSGPWQTAVVREVSHPAPGAVVLRLEVPDRVVHVPGQHHVVRLTAPDGYRAQRSYSLASAPSDPLLELFVERLPGGEVSGFLAEELRVGDEVEVRGPMGRWFTWDGADPVLCVGGGTGVVPFVSMLRHARDVGALDRLQLVVAARALPRLPYADELVDAGATIVLSRQARGDRPAGRLAEADLAPFVGDGRRVLVCGSAGFAESASQLLVALGVPPDAVRVERFGATG